MAHDPESTRSLQRAFAILRTMGRYEEGVRVTDLQRMLRVPRASLYRLLTALIKEEMVVQDHSTGRYRLGTSAMTLGLLARSSMPLIAAAQPVLRDISRESGQLCELVIAPGGWRVMAVDVWHGADMSLEVRIRPGSVAPLTHAYIPGLCFLTFDIERRLRQYLAYVRTAEGRRALGLEAPPAADFLEQLERARRAGFVWNKQSGRNGVGRIAAPVMETVARERRVTASVGIACASTALTTLNAAEWGMLLKRQAARLELELPKHRTP